jgi:hypothetical protein
MRFDQFYLQEMDDYDASEHYITRYEDIIHEIMSEVAHAKPTDRQYWKPLPINRIAKIWSDYMKFNVVRDENGVDDIVNDIVDKIITLDVNTMLLGHTGESPEDVLDDMEIKYTPDMIEKLGDYLTDETGTWRLSDYGLDKLKKIAFDLLVEDSYEKKVLLLDQVLNVVHQRSDLAKWFIQGGRSALDQLSGN